MIYLAIAAGLLLGLLLAMFLTWLAGKFPIRDRPCSVADYHYHRTD